MLDRSLYYDELDWDDGRGRTELTSQSGLFVSLLLRYPEIGSVKYVPSTRCLVVGFFLRQCPSRKEFRRLRSLLHGSMETYSALSGREIHVLKLTRTDYAPLCIVEVTRDIATLTPEELALIVGVLREHCKDRLVCDGAEHPDYEAAYIHDDTIGHLLDDVRQIPPSRRMIGFREGGRVVLFKGDGHNST